MFRAYDPEGERLVAVKLFRLDLQPERVHRLVAELDRLISSAPDHPTVVTPIAAGIDGVTAYLVEEYVAAESLDVVLRQQGEASVEDALRVATQLAGALDAAADAGFNHGALHPRDVLLTADEAKLTGLGIAQALEAAGVPAPMRRPYAAPERTDQTRWDRRADVFALAALVHEMLWGRRVSGAGPEAVAALADVSGADQARLRDVFRRALASDPDDRFESALAFTTALAEAVGRQPSAVSGRQAAGSRQLAAGGSERAEIEAQLPLEPVLGEAASSVDVEPELAMYDLGPPVDRQGPTMVESAAAAKVVELEPLLARRATDLDLADMYKPPPDSALLPQPDQPRRVITLLAFALVIGAALGFAAGFGVGVRRSGVLVETPAASLEETAAAATGAVEPAESSDAVAQAVSLDQPPSTTAPLPAAAPPPAASPAVAAPIVGSLLVRSTPAGARVFVDGREYGRTPVTVGGLARGSHRVRVTRDGYVADERQLTITPGQLTQSVTVRLAPVPVPPASRVASAPRPPAAGSTGRLVVESRPAGASVFVNGKLVGITPIDLPAVPAGEQTVHLERDGYRRWASSVRIVPSERNRVAASLDR